MRWFLKHKLKGGAAISYALLILFVALAIIGNISLLHSFHNKSHIRLDWQDRVLHNVDSGIELILSEGFDTNGEWLETDLFDEEQDSVRLKTKQWGVYRIGMCEARVGKYKQRKGIMIGNKAKIGYSLYLPESNRTIAVGGETRLEGRLFLPDRGLKRSNLEGTNYTGKKLHYGAVKKSDRDIPNIDQKLLKSIIDWFPIEADSIVFLDDLVNDEIINSFFNLTLVLEVNGNLDLYERKIVGNCIIYCSGDVSISNSVHLDGTIIYANKVFVDDDFKGNIQILARDSVFIGSDVTLEYPSAIVSMNEEPDASGYIETGENCKISGEMIVYKHNLINRDWPMLKIGKGSIFQGLLYSNGYSELHGKIAGSVTSAKIIFNREGIKMEGIIVDAEISENNISDQFLTGRIMPSIPETEILKYLK